MSTVHISQPSSHVKAASCRDEMRVELVSSVEAFRALEPVWRLLLARCRDASVFLTWEWISIWWDCLGAGMRPWIFLVRDTRGQIVGLAPFALRKRPLAQLGPHRELSFLGCTAAAPDHLDILCATHLRRQVSDALADYMHAHCQWDNLRLDGMSSRSVFVQSLLKRHGHRPQIRWNSTCPFVVLPHSWEQYLQRLDGKLRYNLRSRAQRLRRDSREKVRFRQTATADELTADMETLFRLHQEGRRRRGDAGAFADPRLRAFHRKLSENLFRNGWLRLYLLEVEQRAIAASYCFRYRDVVSFYQTGFDYSWSKYGAGAAIVAHSIRASIEEGAREFDFLRGDEPYKLRWTHDTRCDLNAHLASNRRGGSLIRAHRLGLDVRKRLKSWLRG